MASVSAQMIISRTVAKRRIAAGIRPSWFGAWGLVTLDLIAVAIVAWMIWVPLSAWITSSGMSIVLAGGLLFCLLFIPTQFLLILSALWAAKSRWQDDI